MNDSDRLSGGDGRWVEYLFVMRSCAGQSSEVMKKIARQMKKEITVDKALKGYYLRNNILVATASIVFMVALLFFINYNYFTRGNTVMISTLALFIYIVLFSIFNVQIDKIWIFWAFNRARNVHELKKRFILLGEISEKSTLFKRIENSTENDRKYWKLRLKFAQNYIFVNDKTIPNETVIYYSKTISIMLIVSLILSFAFGALFLIFAVVEKIYLAALFGTFIMIFSVVVGYFYGYKKLKNREPQLILNNKGICNKTGFYKWEEIGKHVIITTGRSAYLKYMHPRGEESINISYLNIKNNGLKLSKLLMVYRERNKLQNSKIE